MNNQNTSVFSMMDKWLKSATFSQIASVLLWISFVGLILTLAIRLYECSPLFCGMFFIPMLTALYWPESSDTTTTNCSYDKCSKEVKVSYDDSWSNQFCSWVCESKGNMDIEFTVGKIFELCLLYLGWSMPFLGIVAVIGALYALCSLPINILLVILL